MAQESKITQLCGFLSMLAPNKVALGYGLFLAINASSVWGGVFPFLPMEFQTPDIVFWFLLAQSLVFFLSFFASMVGVYFFRDRPAISLCVWRPSPIYWGGCA